MNSVSSKVTTTSFEDSYNKILSMNFIDDPIITFIMFPLWRNVAVRNIILDALVESPA